MRPRLRFPARPHAFPLVTRVALALSLATLCAPLRARAQSAAPPIPATASELQRAQRLIGARQFDSAAVILRPLAGANPQMVPALVALGTAERGLGNTREAAAAFARVAALPRGLGIGAQQLLYLHASTGARDSAYRWFTALRDLGTVDFSLVASNADVAGLAADSRFALLFPTSADFAKPFVETTRIIHEWRGEARGDEFGWIARPIGDVDGDRVTDVAISATQNPPLGAMRGRVYVHSGRSGALLWRKEGDAGARLGIGLESAGDVNRDGTPDVAVGAPGANSVLVLSGSDGRELLRLRGDSSDAGMGSTAAGIGDIDGDGHDDVAGGSQSANGGAGRVLVFSGRNGARLLSLDGAPGERFGSTVGGAKGTLIVGAAGGGARRTGRVSVYRGTSPTPLFSMESDSSGAALGAMFVSLVGDLDRDGVDDVYATDFADGSRGPSTGRAYVWSGRNGARIRAFDGERAGEGFGIGAGRTGDVNGDGIADLVVGSWQYGGSAWSGGRVRVLSGADGRVLQSFTGRVPGETLGFDAVGVGDVDGDGRTDFLITSAWSLVNGARSGRVYIVAGESAARR